MDFKEARKYIKKHRYHSLNDDIEKGTKYSRSTIIRQLKVDAKLKTDASIEIINMALDLIKKRNEMIIVPV